MGAILVRTRSNVGHSSLSGIKTSPTSNGPGAQERKSLAEDKSREKEKERDKEGDKEVERWVRRPLNMGDLKFALARGDVGFGQCRAVVGRVVAAWEEGTLEGWGTYPDSEPIGTENGIGNTNGVLPPRINNVSTATTNGVHHAEDPNEAWGWEGGSKTDRAQLGSLLDDCLAFGQY